jgi:hypothetical protein
MVTGMHVNVWFDDYIKKIKSHVKVNLNRDKESLMNLNLNLLQRIRLFVHAWYHTKTYENNYINKNYIINANAKERPKKKLHEQKN